MTTKESPIDWARAERVALLVAGRTPAPVGPAHVGGRDPTELEDRIEAVTGLRSASGPADVQLIDRAQWVRANLASFRRTLEPLVERWSTSAPRSGSRTRSTSRASTSRASTSAAKSTGTSPLKGAARQIAGAELGALLGWMSTRVLGQYDVLLNRAGANADPAPDGAARPTAANGDAVYLVAPNLATLEQRHGFAPEEFRTWVLLHELTHRAQFSGVPWMRDHFSGLVDESLRLTNPDPKALLMALRDSLRDPDRAREHVRDSGVIGLVASPEQRAVIARIGGLMSLLEGHGDVTMTRAAGPLVPSAERFAAVLRERRRKASPLAKLVQRLIGLEAKLAQYAAGERFIAEIEAVGGERMVDMCWRSPGDLPSLDEIRDPATWVQRVGRRVA